MKQLLQGIQTMEVSQMTNQLFINNEFVESKSNDTMEVINPLQEKHLIPLLSQLGRRS